jgi:hypothetical protein
MTLPGNPDSFGGTPAGDPTAVPEQASAFVPVPSPDPAPLQLAGRARPGHCTGLGWRRQSAARPGSADEPEPAELGDLDSTH